MRENLHIPPPEERISVDEACAICKVDRIVIVAGIKSGAFRAWKPGRKYQIDKYTLNQWFRESEVRVRKKS